MFGLYPTQPYHLVYLFVPLALWLLTRKFAVKRGMTIAYNSTFAVAYWEEIAFRGIIFGIVLEFRNELLPALIVSSLLFGLLHLRNRWWSTPRQVFVNCLYTGLIFGPCVALVRWWTGDIYLGIAIHALHNFLMFSIPTDVSKPTDEFLQAKRKHMNWFEYLCSGFWLMTPKD